MAPSRTLAGFMAWGANRQQPPFALLHSLGSAVASSLLLLWPSGERGGGSQWGLCRGCHRGDVPGAQQCPPVLRGWLQGMG